MGKGDTLAAGGKSATFGPAKVDQEKWDAIWKDEVDSEPQKYPWKEFAPPPKRTKVKRDRRK